MDLAHRPRSLSGKQALAAIGQGRLIALWDNLFSQLEQPIAQVLLTRSDISDRTRYLNAVNTFNELLSMGVVPIVNENDTVSVSEIKFGDNDTLSAVTSSMIHADYLFLMTDVDGLYTSNPRKDPLAKQIEVVTSIAAIRSEVSTTTLGSSLGTGGMETKIIAAEIATAAGVTTIITSSKRPHDVYRIIAYHNTMKAVGDPPSSQGSSIPGHSGTSTPVLERPPHTVFTASPTPIRDAKAWTSHTLSPAGSIVIDAGAHSVLSRRESGGRLLAVGVLGVMGAFASGQAVRIVIRRKTGDTHAEDSREKAAYARALQSAGPSTPTPPSPATPSKSIDIAANEHSTSVEAHLDIEEPISLERLTLDTDPEVIEVGRGLANYNSDQISRVKGLKSSQISSLLGYADSEYVVENVTIRVPPA
ncbi:hypothetical protein HGRIS_013777 [Hohenbuehelia grisea]|uniref:Aspartate/glutamate/uridylate kinase domain-containing protein n=1 Tax=Hohenbuehelia grisea TaxID=104357 RepID=A0ABR3IWE5_9AGAR